MSRSLSGCDQNSRLTVSNSHLPETLQSLLSSRGDVMRRAQTRRRCSFFTLYISSLLNGAHPLIPKIRRKGGGGGINQQSCGRDLRRDVFLHHGNVEMIKFKRSKLVKNKKEKHGSEAAAAAAAGLQTEETWSLEILRRAIYEHYHAWSSSGSGHRLLLNGGRTRGASGDEMERAGSPEINRFEIWLRAALGCYPQVILQIF